MNTAYFVDQDFNNVDLKGDPFERADYENCTFFHCKLTQANLNDCSFTECNFEHCDLSMSTVKKTTFTNTTFKHCKLLGLQFHDCNKFLFSMRFSDCILDLSSFFDRELSKNIHFKDCSLQEVDFSQCNLKAMNFEYCDLKDAIFKQCSLEKADFRTATNFSIDPEINRIEQAQFSTKGLVGLLRKYKIRVDS